ncbi:MAG: T9SS type A sorting domain-containing protein [Bacteroidia bacterium]|nr:T9SS type A sorting domain-containing protein [Bacteroidia bacterium]
MKVFILFLVLFAESILYVHAQIAPESNPHRGIYADMFYKRLPSGEIDPSVSILSVDTNRDGIFEQEDAFLSYCAQNHFTYIALYDLQQIISRNRISWNENTRQWEDMEKHLCRFMKKAKEEYCIDQIGAACGSETGVDSIMSFLERFPITEPYQFRPEQINSPAFDQRLRVAEFDFPIGSKEQLLSEFVKFHLRVTDLNSCGDCGADFDVINSEIEFWGACASDFPDYADMAHHMYAVKNLHNSLNPNEPIITEAYVANLYYCTSPYSMADAVHLLDGCSACAPCPGCTNPHPKLIDRTLYAYLTTNAFYYTHHAIQIFNDTSTADSSDYHPLLYAESADLGGLADYIGAWFPQYFTNNIFLAEMYFYNSWRTNPLINVNLPSESNVQPGAAMWFSRWYMVDPLNNPLTFYSTSPSCAGSGLSTVTFIYNGPPEIGTNYTFWLSRDSDSTIVYPASGFPYTGVTTSFIPPLGSALAVRSINFADTNVFEPCLLPGGDYTAHLLLEYEGGDRCEYQYDQQVKVETKPSLIIMGDTTFCEGHYTWLKSSGGSTYQWYRDTSAITGAIYQAYKATETGTFYCVVGGGGAGCSGNTDSVYIYVKPNPMVHINRLCHGNDLTMIANARDTLGTPLEFGDGGVTYQWSNGATTDRITVNYTGEMYRLLVTDPYTGCWRFSDKRAPSSPSKTYNVAIQALTVPSSACIPDGTLQCQYAPSHSMPVSYLWSSGESTQTLQDVYPGTYSVMTTVYDNSCSYFASYTLGPLPTGGPSINENIIPVSCQGEASGEIQLNLSGGTGPFTFFWENIPIDSLHDPYSQNAENLYPGSYTVNIFDANGCRFQERFTVPVSNAKFDVSIISVTPVTLCATNSDGAATVSASGGNAPYQYYWNDPLLQIGASVANLPSGTWRVTAIDDNGCEERALVSIPSSPPILLEECDSSFTWLSCANDSTGSLMFCIQGGTPPYSVASPWIMPDSIHISLDSLPVGIYTASITDANGCTFNQNAEITAPSAINVSTIVTSTTCIGCTNGSIQLNPSGGIQPYTFTITPALGAVNGMFVEQLPSGIYTICVTDANGCSICAIDTIFDDPTKVPVHDLTNVSMLIFPNPSSRGAKLRYTGISTNEQVELKIVDMAGRVIYQKAIDKNGELELPNKFSAGIYYVGLVQTSNNVFGIWKKWFVRDVD